MIMGLFSKGVKLPDAGFFEGFTDAHSHILPGVDDGVSTIEESLRILDRYERMGVKSVILTPHVMEDIPNTTSFLKSRFSELEAAYAGPLILYLASENMIDGLFDQRLEKNDFLPMPGKRLLVETSYYTAPMDLVGRLDKVRSTGYFPVLAHPERYMYMEISDYGRIRNMGVHFQMNIPSMLGLYGPDALAKSYWLLDHGYYDFAGTDIHSERLIHHLLGDKTDKKRVQKAAHLHFQF